MDIDTYPNLHMSIPDVLIIRGSSVRARPAPLSAIFRNR